MVLFRRYAARFMYVFLAMLMLANLSIPTIFADNELPDSELKALNDYPHWVACGSDTSAGDRTTEAAGITPGPIYILGDSITNIAKDKYTEKFSSPWQPEIAGLDSRQITGSSTSGVGQIQKDKTKIGNANAIVIALGTNGVTNSAETTTNQVKQLMEKLKTYNQQKAPVFWVNVIDSKHDRASKTTNSAIKDGVGDNANIIDWYKVAKADADLDSFESGVHPTKQKDIELLADLVYEKVTTADPGSFTGIPTNGPVSTKKPTPDTKIKVGDSFKGTASNYGWDSVTGYVDPNDGNDPASGISNDKPGIAVYNQGTLRGWWLVVTADGKGAILQQTDVGPGADTAFIDINTVAVRSVYGMQQGDSFLKKNWTFKYLGKRKPANAITSDTGKKEDRTAAVSAETGAGIDLAAEAPAGAKCCPAGSGAGGDVTTTGNNAKDAFNFFTAPERGLSAVAAAALVGNMQAESSEKLDPKLENERGAYGIVQWLDGRRTKLENFAKERGKPPSDFTTQLLFSWQELQGSPYNENVLKPLKAEKDVDRATDIVFTFYEAPGDDTLPKRQGYAKKLLASLGQGVVATAPQDDDESADEEPTSIADIPAEEPDCSAASGTAGANGYDLDKMTVFDQNDPKWASKPYGEGKTSIGASGCGITSLAMVVSTLTGKKETPLTLAKKYGDQYHGAEGTTWGLWPVAADEYNLKFDDLGTDLNQAASAVKSGGLVIISVDAGEFTGGGHLMVIRAVDDEGNFLLADPNYSGNKSHGKDTNNKAYSADFLRTQGALKHLWSFSK